MAPESPVSAPNRITPQKENEILRLTVEPGNGSHVIARRVGVSQTTVLRVWRRHKIDRKQLMERNQLIEDHVSLALRVGRSVAAGLPLNMRDELPGVAQAALAEAARSFDPGYGVPFPYYMQQRVRGACIDSIRRRHYTNANASEYAQDANESREDTAVSIEQQMIASEAREEQKAKAVDAIGRLPGRLAVLVWLHYIEGQTLEAIAPKFGVVSSRVSQLHREALAAMRLQGGHGQMGL